MLEYNGRKESEKKYVGTYSRIKEAENREWRGGGGLPT